MRANLNASFRPPFRLSRRNGFTLIVSLLMMMLILVLAVGLLQLATISLRSTDQQEMLSQARANARMSLMLAIGQLQQELGPDRRISAPAGVRDTDAATAAIDGVAQPNWTGVWGATESPFKNWTLANPSYVKTSPFRRWLVSSGNPDETAKLGMAATGPAAGGQTCNLVPSGSAAGSNHGVSVPVVQGPRSGFAWWTSDDGVKAVLRPDEKPDSTSQSKVLLTTRRTNSDGHVAMDPKLPDRDHGLDQRLVSLATVDAAISSPSGTDRAAWKYIHDLTTRSEILPVDVTTGSLRKCMNLRLDWLGTQTPAERAAAGTIGTLYDDSADRDCRLFSWDQLRNYESLARAGSMLQINPATGRPEIHTYQQAGDAPEAEWNPSMSEDRFRIKPVLQKFAVMVSCGTEKIPNPIDPEKPYALRLYLYPIVVLWNPYNVDLVVNEYTTACYYPLVLNVKIGQDSYSVNLLSFTNEHLAFGPEMRGPQASDYKPLRIPAGASKALYPQPVRLDTPEHRGEHRAGVASEFYIWAQMKDAHLDYAESSNYGGVLKNLKGSPQSIWNFDSNRNDEICGAEGDQVSVEVKVSGSDSTTPASFGVNAAHSDWWGTNGPNTPGNHQAELHKFNCSTWVNYQISGQSPQISVIAAGEVPTHTVGSLATAPQPTLLYECYRKAANEDKFPSKMGSFSVPATALHSPSMGSDNTTPWFENPYAFRFKAITNTFDLTEAFHTSPDQPDRVYFGASYKSDKGQLNVVDQEIPLSPLVSLGSLQHLPLFDYRPIYDPNLKTYNLPYADWGSPAPAHWFHLGQFNQFSQNHAIGNSYASPGIDSRKLAQPGWDFNYFGGNFQHLRMDRSYIANAVLWDAWFCSSIGAQDGLMLTKDGSNRSTRQVAEELFNGTNPPPNDAVVARSDKPVKEVIDSLFSASGVPTIDAYQKIAEFVRIEGGFNINSVSEEAWTHFLCGLLSRPHLAMKSVTGNELPAVVAPEAGKFLISRYSLANEAPADRVSGKEREDRYWNGSREVSASQIRELASAIVRQVKKRGPFLSLAEFVNRRLSSKLDPLALSGTLQSALDDPKVSINAPFRGDLLTGNERADFADGTSTKPLYLFAEAAKGPRRQGITGYVTQADLLQSLGSRISPRSDTFTIRAMGEAKDAKGKVISRVWCEAVVQRTAAYVDPADAASTPADSLTQPANVQFGRRFEIISLRWLSPLEVQS